MTDLSFSSGSNEHEQTRLDSADFARTGDERAEFAEGSDLADGTDRLERAAGTERLDRSRGFTSTERFAGIERSEPTQLDELVAVMERLRGPGGCPWDADQTHESLVRYLVEETYELVEAIETGSRDDLLEELGDVLYQVLFHADIAAHTPGEDFDIQDVAAQMTAKMVGRHPHVFGDRKAETPDEVMEFWDDLKRREKPGRTSVLDGIPQGMPSLALADKLVGRAQKVGVLPPDDATASEIGALALGSEDELGALLLAIVAAAKAQGLDPERALRGSLRELQGEIRAAESASSGAGASGAGALDGRAQDAAAPDAGEIGSDASDPADAGVIGLPAID